jgi:hypothetical protein
MAHDMEMRFKCDARDRAPLSVPGVSRHVSSMGKFTEIINGPLPE